MPYKEDSSTHSLHALREDLAAQYGLPPWAFASRWTGSSFRSRRGGGLLTPLGVENLMRAASLPGSRLVNAPGVTIGEVRRWRQQAVCMRALMLEQVDAFRILVIAPESGEPRDVQFDIYCDVDAAERALTTAILGDFNFEHDEIEETGGPVECEGI